MRSRSLALFLNCSLLIASAGVLAAQPSAESSEACFHDKDASQRSLGPRLQALERQILLRLHQLARNPGRPADAGAAAVEELNDRLDALAAEAHRLDAPAAASPIRKIGQLRDLVVNLELAAGGGDLGAALPRVFGPSPDRVRHPAEVAGAPANDDCADAVEVSLGDTLIGDTSGATTDGQAGCGSSLFSNDVWFKLTAAEGGNVYADTLGSAYDTVLSVHSGCPGDIDNQIACNDDAFGLQSGLSFYAYPGNEYWIRLSGFDQAAGEYELHVGLGGGISGTVTSAETGDPLAGGQVRLWTQQGYYAGSATTGAAGEYAVGGLEAGAYFLSTRNFEGFFDEIYDDVPCPGGYCDVTAGTPVEVQSLGATAGIDFALEQGGAIAGVVTETMSGLPIAGARVEIYAADGSHVANGYSDEAGTYEVRGLTSGTYYAVAESSPHRGEIYDDLPCLGGAPYSCDPGDGTPIEVQEPDTVGGVDFVLDRLGTISGTVTEDGSGDPIAALRVEIFRSDGSYVGSAYTGSGGGYLAGGLTAGEYVVASDSYAHSDELYDGVPCPNGPPYGCDLADGTPIAIDLNVAVTGVDMALEPLGAISGTVTDATGEPIAGSRVRVYLIDGPWVDYDYTDADGHYQVDRLEAGSYVALASHAEHIDELYDDVPCPGGLFDGCEPEDGAPVAVELGVTTGGVDFALERLGEITGTVTDAVTGDPIAYSDLILWTADGSSMDYVYTDFSGQYRFIGLATGSYFVATRNYWGYLDEVYDDRPCPSTGCDPETGDPVAVVAGSATTGIDFALDLLGAVSGTVTVAATGAPADDSIIEVYDAEGHYVASDYTYGSASYLVGDLVPGTYFVVARNYRYVSEVYDDIPCPPGCDPTLGTPITVSVNQTAEGIDFALEDRGAISATVVDVATGLPIPDVRVELWDEAASYPYDFRWTDAAGVALFEELDSGTYYVSTDNGLGYLDELYDDVPCLGGAPYGCDPTKGTEVVVVAETTREIDLSLLYFDSGIAGKLTDGAGTALAGASVEVWDAAGSLVATVQTLSTGEYFAQLDPGTYYVSTDNGMGFADEIYPNVPCLEGPPPDPCDPQQGAPLTVAGSGAGMIVTGIDFALEVSGSWIFLDGFESGDVSAW